MVMNKELEAINEMAKLFDAKNKSFGRALSRKEEEEAPRVSREYRTEYANTGYIAYVHVNCMNDKEVRGKASYLLSKYRYSQEPRKHIR